MCQSQTAKPLSKANGEPSGIGAFSLVHFMDTDTLISFDIPSLPFKARKQSEKTSVLIMNTNYLDIYNKSLGIFCKAENKLSAKAPVQFRMRLGSLDYVNGLEGK